MKINKKLEKNENFKGKIKNPWKKIRIKPFCEIQTILKNLKNH